MIANRLVLAESAVRYGHLCDGLDVGSRVGADTENGAADVARLISVESCVGNVEIGVSDVDGSSCCRVAVVGEIDPVTEELAAVEPCDGLLEGESGTGVFRGVGLPRATFEIGEAGSHVDGSAAVGCRGNAAVVLKNAIDEGRLGVVHGHCAADRGCGSESISEHEISENDRSALRHRRVSETENLGGARSGQGRGSSGCCAHDERLVEVLNDPPTGRSRQHRSGSDLDDPAVRHLGDCGLKAPDVAGNVDDFRAGNWHGAAENRDHAHPEAEAPCCAI